MARPDARWPRAFAAVAVWVDGAVGAVLLAVVVAAVIATIARLADLVVRRWIDRRSAHVASTVVAGRFDVVVSARAEEAEHVLASWWDPDAMPVRAREGAD